MLRVSHVGGRGVLLEVVCSSGQIVSFLVVLIVCLEVMVLLVLVLERCYHVVAVVQLWDHGAVVVDNGDVVY